jgi:glycosyltransferase involved in cell wall biosynthesis
LRDIVWRSGRWKSKEFKNWINEFSPEVVLLMAHNYSYSFKIALEIVKKKKIPLVVYNCEDYYLKKGNKFSPIYMVYEGAFKRAYKKTMKEAAHVIYNSKMLQNSYAKEFENKSSVMYMPTELKPCANKKENSVFTVSYLGNFGNGRHEVLIEVANTLKKIDNNIIFNAYGEIKNEGIREVIEACSAINYKGFVSYDRAQEVMYTSDLLVHVENFGEFYRSDLKHGFTTKISDCLASGTCFFVYAPEDIAGVQYLIENDATCVCSKPEELFSKLNDIVNNKSLRNNYIGKALDIASINHNKELICKSFHDVIISIIE